MQHIMSALVAAFLIVAAAAPASAACHVNGWIDTGQNPKPIWKCDQPEHSRTGQMHHARQHG
jgi:hypothetical protein